MIQKIGQAAVVKNSYVSNKSVKPNHNMENSIQSNPIDLNNMPNYQVSFGKKSKEQSILDKKYGSSCEELIDRANEIAKEYKHSEITELHVEKANLEIFSKYLDDLDAGVTKFGQDVVYQTPTFFSDFIGPTVINDPKERAKLKPAIQEEIANLEEELQKMPRKKGFRSVTPVLSKDLAVKTLDMFIRTRESNDSRVADTDFLNAIYQLNKGDKANFRGFIMKLSNAVMKDSRPSEEKVFLSSYYPEAKNLLKNLSLGTNMFVTYDSKVNPIYMVDTIQHLFESPENDFGKLNPSNTELTIFNKNLQEDLFVHTVGQFAKDETTNHVIIFDSDDLLKAASQLPSNGGEPIVSVDFFNALENPPKNVKFIMLESKKSYFTNQESATLQRIFGNFGEVSIPSLSSEEVEKELKDQPLITAKIDKVFSKRAKSRIIETCSQSKTDYIDSVRNLMKKMAAYYVDKKEITEADAKEYIKQSQDLYRATSADSSIEVVLDTGVDIKDIIGKKATQKEAQNYINQIKSGIMGTKGAIIYSEDDSVGSGRKFTAKAIAKGTKSPYIEIDARNFGAEALDLFGSDPVPTEKAIKQLSALIKTQAEASPYKSALVVIKNFEYLPFGQELTSSPYYPKSLSQFQDEMENWAKNGLNVLVLGSVSDERTAKVCSDNILTFKDKIKIDSPAIDSDARVEILDYFLKKERIKLAGTTEQEKNEIIKLMSETTEGYPFVKLTNLVNKIKMVAFERKHKVVTKGDVIEAYLQLETGRPSSKKKAECDKKIVASHECGHGFNLEYMHRLAEKQNVPWYLPESVNFITLDPRGWYGGMMCGKNVGNNQYTFEKLFADEVCDFGGYSAEKHFYNMDGSLGISEDIKMATESAESAIGVMGQGHKFGQKSVNGMNFEMSEKALEKFEQERDVRLKNARLVSDLITKFGTTFNQEFTKKYSPLVGTGEGIVLSEQFKGEINEWLSRQSEEKLKEMNEVDEIILDIIEATKKGKFFNIEAKNVSENIKNLYKSVAHNIRR